MEGVSGRKRYWRKQLGHTYMALVLKELSCPQQGGPRAGFISSGLKVSFCLYDGFTGLFVPVPSGIDLGQWCIVVKLRMPCVHAHMPTALSHVGRAGLS